MSGPAERWAASTTITYTSGGYNTASTCTADMTGHERLEAIRARIAKKEYDRWLACQPWFVRLDEWGHNHGPGVGRPALLWCWAWSFLCPFAEHHHRGARPGGAC